MSGENPTPVTLEGPPLKTRNPVPRSRRIVILFLLFALGVLTGWGFFAFLNPRTEAPSPREYHAGHTGLLNPLLDLRSPDAPTEELRPFRDELLGLVKTLEQGCPDRHIAVYFRDLDNGPWLGVNEKERFLPASLIKVPILLAALKQGEYDPSFLQRKVRSPKEYPPETELAGFDALSPDTLYTVQELVEKTAVLSANDAAWVLLNNLEGNTIDDALDLLGLPADLGQILDVNYALSPRDYGVFFRVLYNATYLDKGTSQYLLELFTRSTFRDGLVAGVPEQVLVAHKFGIHPLRRPGTQERWLLHDAGIVYHPRRPYLLCVMTVGCDRAALQRSIASISALVWDKVDASIPEGQ